MTIYLCLHVCLTVMLVTLTRLLAFQIQTQCAISANNSVMNEQEARRARLASLIEEVKQYQAS